jgi:hypothetical protein
MWRVRDIHTADIVIMHTDFTVPCFPYLKRTLMEMKRGAKFVTYQDLVRFWPYEYATFEQIEANADERVRWREHGRGRGLYDAAADR